MLSVASVGFRMGSAMWHRAYDAGLKKAQRVTTPVVSVGNLTVGGTGKTPLVIHLAKVLAARGETVAVLARGYGAKRDGDLNDELRVVQAEAPDALLFPGADRVVRAGEAIGAGATVLLLDDGFQHRRLARDLDIVILDATEPWGCPPGALLPRGLLREPPRALSRAHALVVSRVELVGAADIVTIEEQARGFGFKGPVLKMSTRATKLSLLALADGAENPGESIEQLDGLSLVAACGIGNPNAFGATLASLAARTTQLVARPDHHAYIPWDIKHLEDLAKRRAVKRIVVTEKDAVKLRGLLDGPRPVTWQALGIEASVDPAQELDGLLSGLRGEEPSPAAKGDHEGS